MSNASEESLFKVVTQALHPSMYAHPSKLRLAGVTKWMDYERMAWILAAVDAAKFLEEHFLNVKNLIDWEPTLRYACRLVPTDGAILEFGVQRGTSLRWLCEEFPDQTVHGFDSFQGLPEGWILGWQEGAFSTHGQTPVDLPNNAKLHIGLFQETIPDFRQIYKSEPIGFLHIDCDLYSSTHDILFQLADQMKPGTIILFDDFLNYPGWRQHEYRAFMEFVNSFQVNFDYVAYSSSHMSVAVRINSLVVG